MKVVKESKFTHEVMQPLKVECDTTLEDGLEFLEFLKSFPEDKDESARLGTLSREQVENLCADFFQEMIEDMEKK